MPLLNMPLYIETITSTEGLRSLEADWRTLFVESGVRLPFMTFEWCEVWWRIMRQDRRAIKDQLRVFVIRTSQGRVVAIAPMILTERPASGPVTLRFLQFFGADVNITEIRGMLVLSEFEEESYRSLLETIEANEKCDWVRWSGWRVGTGAESILEGRISERAIPVENLYVNLPDTWEAFQQGLKRNIRESLRKCYNSLKRDGLTFEIRIARSRNEVQQAVVRFVGLHSLRAASERSSVPHVDVFAATPSRDFLLEVCRRFADNDTVRIFEMTIDGEVVASRIGFQFSDALYLYYSGYDPAWAKYSVMTTTVAEAVRYAIEEGLTYVGLSTGRDVSKTRWGPRVERYEDGVRIRPSLRSRTAYAVYKRAIYLRQFDPFRKVMRRIIR